MKTTTEEVLQDQEVVQEVGLNEEPQQEPSESPQVEEEVKLPSDEAQVEIPEKFKDKSVEDIIKAYQELEKKLGGAQEEAPQDTKEETPPTQEETPEQKDVSQFQKYLDKVKQGEELGDEDYAELEKLGYTKEFVNEQVEFIQYKAQQYISEILEPVGGIDTYKEAVLWAKDNWSEEQINEFNSAMGEAPKMAKQALAKELIEEYNKANTGPIHTNAPVGTRSKGYASETDFMNDISDPRYGKDPAYTRAVEEKMSQTDTTGWVGFSSHMGDAS